MPSRRVVVRVGFPLFGLLTVLGLFVLDGAAAGVVLFAALLLFTITCILALSIEETGETTKGSERTGITGWIRGRVLAPGRRRGPAGGPAAAPRPPIARSSRAASASRPRAPARPTSAITRSSAERAPSRSPAAA